VVVDPLDRFARHRLGQHRRAIDQDAGEHLRLEQAFRIGQGAADTGGAQRRIEGRADPIQPPLEDALGVGENAGLDRRTRPDLRELALGNVGEEPHHLRPADDEELGGRRPARKLSLHLQAWVHVARDHPAFDGADQRELLLHRIHLARAQEAQPLQRAILFRLRLAVVVLRGFEVATRAGAGGDDLLLPGEFMLRRRQISAGLHLVGDGAAHVGRGEDEQRRTLFHRLAQLRDHTRDAAGHRREDVGDAQIVERDAPSSGDRRGDQLPFRLDDLCFASLENRRSDPLLVLGWSSLPISSPVAAGKERASEDEGDSHRLSCVAVACSRRLTAIQ